MLTVKSFPKVFLQFSLLWLVSIASFSLYTSKKNQALPSVCPPIKQLKTAIRYILVLIFLRLDNPNSFRISSYVMCSCLLTLLVVFCWTHQYISLFLFILGNPKQDAALQMCCCKCWTDRKVPSTSWCHSWCSPRCCLPSLLQGHVSGLCSTWCPLGLLVLLCRAGF